MATRKQAEAPHTFNERDHGRIAKVVKTVEGEGEGGSTHRRRYPIGDEGPVPKVAVRGTLNDKIDGGQLVPAVGVDLDEPGLINPAVPEQGGTITHTGRIFAVNYHDVDLESGIRVTCVPWKDKLWQIIQADCKAPTPPPPPPGCPGPEPVCSTGTQEPCCVNGVWSCCDLPPPPGDCVGPLPDGGCANDSHVCCGPLGFWICCPNDPQPMPAPP